VEWPRTAWKLKEESGSWKENMEGANMEHLPKYDEVSECYDALETAYDSRTT